MNREESNLSGLYSIKLAAAGGLLMLTSAGVATYTVKSIYDLRTEVRELAVGPNLTPEQYFQIKQNVDDATSTYSILGGASSVGGLAGFVMVLAGTSIRRRKEEQSTEEKKE